MAHKVIPSFTKEGKEGWLAGKDKHRDKYMGNEQYLQQSNLPNQVFNGTVSFYVTQVIINATSTSAAVSNPINIYQGQIQNTTIDSLILGERDESLKQILIEMKDAIEKNDVKKKESLLVKITEFGLEVTERLIPTIIAILKN